MKIKKQIQRLLTFFIGVPGFAALILFLPQYNHLALNIAAILFSSFGAIELALMLKSKGFHIYVLEAAILGSLAPLSATFIVSFGANNQVLQSLFVLGASWVLVSEIFFNGIKTGFSRVLGRLAAAFSIMIYPGIFLSWIITMAANEHSSIIIVTFLVSVMANDGLAWFTGKLFGRNNSGIFAASPNKSIAGYLGGMGASIGICIAIAHFFPHVFVPYRIAKLPSVIILGFVSGIAVILGDLVESAIKRSCGFEDSGNIIPGRGGALDSIDSIAFAAPFFYMLYRFFF